MATKSTLARTSLTGLVEKIEFTLNGAGNQWTTIAGVRYATFWDCRAINWKVGDVVSFQCANSPLWSGSSPIPHASNIVLSTPTLMTQQREALADDEFQEYDFGIDVTLEGADSWDTTDAADFTRIVYFTTDDDAPDADSHRISFHVRFNPNGTVDDAYALLMQTGSDIGMRGSSCGV